MKFLAYKMTDYVPHKGKECSKHGKNVAKLIEIHVIYSLCADLKDLYEIQEDYLL